MNVMAAGTATSDLHFILVLRGKRPKLGFCSLSIAYIDVRVRRSVVAAQHSSARIPGLTACLTDCVYVMT